MNVKINSNNACLFDCCIHALRQILRFLRKIHFSILFSSLFASVAFAGSPLWTLKPLTPTQLNVARGEKKEVVYVLTNNTRTTRSLYINPIPGASSIPGGQFLLAPGESKEIVIMVDGSQLDVTGLNGGPVVCQSKNACYQPSEANSLNISLNKEAITNSSGTKVDVGPKTDNGRAVTGASGLTVEASRLIPELGVMNDIIYSNIITNATQGFIENLHQTTTDIVKPPVCGSECM